MKYVEFGRKAEKISKAFKNGYPELAFAGGIIFDLIKGKLSTLIVEEKEGIETPMEFLENIWKRSVRAALAAQITAEHVNLAHRRYSYFTGLVHNIGKLVLYAYDPKNYMDALHYIKNNKSSSGMEEIRRFGIDHSMAGSLYLGQLKFLGEIEMAVDFHHGNWLLKFQNVPIYHFSALIFVAAHMVSQVKDKDTMILDEKSDFFCREEFLCLGLSLAEFTKVQKKFLKYRDYEKFVPN